MLQTVRTTNFHGFFEPTIPQPHAHQHPQTGNLFMQLQFFQCFKIIYLCSYSFFSIFLNYLFVQLQFYLELILHKYSLEGYFIWACTNVLKSEM